MAAVALPIPSLNALMFGTAWAAAIARSTCAARLVTTGPLLATIAASAPRRAASSSAGSRLTSASIT